jgi:hypothetical protein
VQPGEKDRAREDVVSPEGVLDPANSGPFVRTFSLGEESVSVSEQLEQVMPAFRRRVEHFTTD